MVTAIKAQLWGWKVLDIDNTLGGVWYVCTRSNCLDNGVHLSGQAQEAEAALRSARTELSTLRYEVDSLEKQRGILAPTIADWEKRLKEKAEAEAALATLESKRRQAEADIAQAAKRLEDTNKDLVRDSKKSNYPNNVLYSR